MNTSNNKSEVSQVCDYYPCGTSYKDPHLNEQEEIEKPVPTKEDMEDFIAWIRFKDPILQYYFDELLGEDEVSEECFNWVLDRWCELRKELTDSSKKDYDSFNAEFDVYGLI